MQTWKRRSLLAVAAGCLFTAGIAQAAREFPDSSFCFKANEPNQAKLEALVGQKAPPLQLADWIGKPVTEADMAGKVVLIDIWATWCGPCKAAIPHTNEIAKKYAKDGLVVVGVCSSDDGQDELPATAKKHDIQYPVAKDPDTKTATAYNVGFYPTYVAIDRAGKVRAIGLTPDGVEPVLKKLLAEKAPAN